MLIQMVDYSWLNRTCGFFKIFIAFESIEFINENKDVRNSQLILFY